MLEQVNDAPVPPVQLDLRVAAALPERDELAGGGKPGAQILRRPKHDVRGCERHGERAGIRERACRRDRLLDERPSARLGRRVGESDGKPGEQPHPKRSLGPAARRSSASSRSATSGSSTATIVTPSPAAPSAARASRSSRGSSRASRAASSNTIRARSVSPARRRASPSATRTSASRPSGCPAAGKSLGALEELDRVLPGQPLDGLSPGGQRVGEGGLGVGPGAGKRVVCERGQPLLGRALGPLGQHLCDAAVQVGAPRGRQLSDERVSHERVREREPLGSRQLPHQARPQGVVERVQHRLLRLARSRPHELHVELGAGDCGKLEQPSCALREPADTCSDDLVHGVRERDGIPLPSVLRQLANKERVPTSSLAQRTGRGPIWARPRQRLHDGGNGRLVEPVQDDSDDRPVAPYLGERLRERVARASLDVPGASEQEQRDALRPCGQAAHEEQRRPIRPVQVVEGEHERTRRRDLFKQLGDGVEHSDPVALRVRGRLARAACREFPEAVPEDVRDRERRQRLREWLVRPRRLLLAAAVQHECPSPLHCVRKLRQHTGLPNARLTGHQRDTALAAPHPRERLVQTSARRLPPREGITPNRIKALGQRQAGCGRRGRTELLAP